MYGVGVRSEGLFLGRRDLVHRPVFGFEVRSEGSGFGFEVRSEGSGFGFEVRSEGSGVGFEVRSEGSGFRVQGSGGQVAPRFVVISTNGRSHGLLSTTSTPNLLPSSLLLSA